MSDLALILFDVDGTLVNSQAHILTAMEATFLNAGLPMPRDADIMGGIGLSLPILMRKLCPDASEAQIDALVTGYKGEFVTVRTTQNPDGLSPLYPGIAPLLDRLEAHHNWLLGVATGKSRRGLDHLFDLHSWHNRFVTRQCADDHPSKPHPSMVLTAMAEAGVTPERTLVIGDTTFDIEMARAAGAQTIGVSWGYHQVAALHDAGALAVVETAEDIDRQLATILGE